MTEADGKIEMIATPAPTKKFDFDDVDLGIITIGVIAILLLILLIVYLIIVKENANPGAMLGVVASAITAIATLAGRKQKSGESPTPLPGPLPPVLPYSGNIEIK